MSWKPAPHPLRWPLTVDDTTLAELPLRPILHGEHAELMRRLEALKSERAAEGKPMEDIEFDELAFLSLASMTTGLAERDVKRLKRPDFNGLASRVLEMVSKKSTHFMTAEQRAASTPDCPLLLVPLRASTGATLESLELEVPDLEASQMMRKLKTPHERAEFITAKCTGLIASDLAQLTTPDWNTLQERVNHFLNETGDFFPLGTSTS